MTDTHDWPGFEDQLRREAFALAAARGSERVGAEVEVIPIDALTGRIAPIEEDDAPATLPVLRSLAHRLGWQERRSAKAGVPELSTRGGGRLTYEPGGQIEYAAPPNESVSALVADLHAVTTALREEMAAAGIELVSRGIDPLNAIEDVPIRLTGERYRRMDRHFATIGPHGARMMRQTASIQICVDAGEYPMERWHLLNALAPYLVAIFANSSVYEGRVTGHESIRRHIWGQLDSSRTGLAWDDDPIAGYAQFAMNASAILVGDEGERCRPFREYVRRGEAGPDEWRSHLTTLFPEVRPRGYLEVRSIDALEPEWYAAPLAFVVGLTRDRHVAQRAAEAAGPPDPDLLVRAGVCGLADARIAARARQLVELALEGCESLGTGVADTPELETFARYVDRYARRGRSPSGDAASAVAV